MPSARAPHISAPDVMRGVAGASILGVPLLYTQEVWLHGATLDPLVIAGVLAAAFAIAAALSHVVGFERGHPQHAVESAVIAVGTSLVLALLLLILLDRVRFDMPVRALAGIVTLTTAPMAVGFAVGNALVPREGGKGSERMTGNFGDLLAAAAGAIFLVLNIAPTEEPVLLAGELGWGRLAVMVLVSVVLPYLMVFYAEFEGREKRHASDGATQGPIVETLLAYLVALVLSGLMLAAFGRTESIDVVALAEGVVLAFPASVGAALGRMLV